MMQYDNDMIDYKLTREVRDQKTLHWPVDSNFEDEISSNYQSLAERQKSNLKIIEVNS